ncbi:MAG: MerR family transcriptional regulator [Candidatus Helarchaeales archaeon]
MTSMEQISIGRFSLITRLSKKALRIYDKKGILVPLEKDIITGYRYYSLSQIEVGIKIKILTTLGFRLDEVARILKALKKENSVLVKEIFSKCLSEV